MARHGSTAFAVGDRVLWRESHGGRTGKVVSYDDWRPGRVEALVPNVSGFLWMRSEGAPILQITVPLESHKPHSGRLVRRCEEAMW